MDIKEYLTSGKAGKNHPWEMARFKVVYDIIQKHLPIGKKVIADVGCGDTFFIENLNKQIQGNELLAIDTAFENELIRLLQDKRKIDNLFFFKDISEVKKTADVVFLMDVIEHIEDDKEFIQRLYNSNLIKNETLLLITVPAFNCLFCNHDIWLGHYRRYTSTQVRDVFKSEQIHIISEGYFFKSLVLPRYIQKKLEKKYTENNYKGSDVSQWNKGSLATSIYKNILWIDYMLFNKLMKLKRFPGLSCYLLVKIKK